MPEIEKFVEFWGGIWEREDRMPNMKWMEEIKSQLNEKVNQVKEFNITFEKVKKEVAKRKGWKIIRIYQLGGQLEELFYYQKPGG